MEQVNQPLDLVEQEAQRQEAAVRREVERKLKAEDLQWLMSGKRGRRIVWRLLEFSGAHRIAFAGDTNQTMFNLGQQNFGLALEAWIFEACPDMYGVMRSEHFKDTNG